MTAARATTAWCSASVASTAPDCAAGEGRLCPTFLARLPLAALLVPGWKLMERANGRVTVEGLSSEIVTSPDEVMQALARGNARVTS